MKKSSKKPVARLGGRKSPRAPETTLPKRKVVVNKGVENRDTAKAWKKTTATRSLNKKVAKPTFNEENEDEESIMSRTVYNPKTGESIVLREEEVALIQKLINNEYADDDYDPYQPSVDFFTKDKLNEPVARVREPKTRSLPSRMEMRKIRSYVKAIKSGKLVVGQPSASSREEGVAYDVWEREFEPSYRRAEYIPAPKMKLPTHAESYNPSEEYLPSAEERKEWQQADSSIRQFLPVAHKAMRHIPAYDYFIQERFARCLDLYMCARQRRNKLMIDPDSMLPKLPSRDELRPYPETKSTEFLSGHDGKEVKMVSVDPQGKWLASAGGDYVVVWEINSGRAVYQVKFMEPVQCVSWRPDKESDLCLAFGAGNTLYIVTPFSNNGLTFDEEQVADASSSVIEWQTHKKSAVVIPGLQVSLKHPGSVQSIQWHRKGDYFVSVCQAVSAAETVAVHQLSKRLSQHPFRKLSSPTGAVFSPVRPQLLVSTKLGIRVYDLKEQRLEKKLQATGAMMTTLPAMHSGGDNLVIGAGDGRVFWFDLDLSSEPYRALQPSSGFLESIRGVAMHPRLPLFVSVSASHVQVLHGGVSDDLNVNALIVPLKRLEEMADGSCVAFHPIQPWIFVGDARGNITLFV